MKHLDSVALSEASDTLDISLERRRNEDLQRAIFNSPNILNIRTDPKGIIQTFNVGAERMLNYTADEVMYKLTLADISDPQEVIEHARDLSVEFDTEIPLGFDALVFKASRGIEDIQKQTYIRKDGSRFSAVVSVTALRDDQGAINGYLLISTDVLERKKPEQIFNELMESVPDAMVIVNNAAEIVMVNSLVVKLSGWRREELIGHKVEMLIPERYRSRHLGHRNIFCAQPRVRAPGQMLEFFGLRKDGTEFPVEVSLSPLETDEGPQVISAIRDITERKAIETRFKYLSRIHAMLSGINSLIMRVNDRDELFRKACQIAIEAGEFRMSMICIVDQKTNKIVPAATAGKNEELLAVIEDILASVEDVSKTMVGVAVRDKQVILANDSVNDVRLLFGKKYADAGVRSLAIFPLIVSGEAIGAVAMYASEIEFFREEEMELLTQLSDDIAFAVDHLENKEKLNYLAFYDVLTGLPNRNLFLNLVEEYLGSTASRGHRIALCFIDLERFKSINDSLGRQVGDALLMQVAKWLANNTGTATC